MLLAAPDSEGDQNEGAEDDGTANADDDTDNSVTGLNRHASSFGVLGVEGCCLGGPCRGSLGLLRAIRVGLNNNFDLG